MVKTYKNIFIREYRKTDRALIESFRIQTIKEGNNSLSLDKYDPNNVKGQTWMLFIDKELASISVCEASHYTGDSDISARICRYHILKKYRHCNSGFRFLPRQVHWARKNGFKVVYWTQDIKNKPLNILYQHKKKMPGKGHFFEDELYKSFKINQNFLFKVSPKSDFLQYIYFKVFQPGYSWTPKKNIIPIKK